MDTEQHVPMRPSLRRIRLVLSLLISLALLLSLSPLANTGSVKALADEALTVPLMIHFKETDGETVDFAQLIISVTRQDDWLAADLSASGDFTLEEASLSVYDHYAAFNDLQQDITDECEIHLDHNEVNIPLSYKESLDTLALVAELPITHPAYEQLVLADLDMSPLEVSVEGQKATLESDIPSLLAESTENDGIVAFAASFPGTTETHYRLNPYTRLETFDVDMPRKQEAYGVPSDLVGSYGFGVFFGSAQHHENGVSTGTSFKESVLNTDHSSYNETIEAFFAETIAARNGSNATFATSRDGNTYRDRYVTTGNDYKDSSYSGGSAPTNRAMAHGTCGSAGTSNGYGAVASNPNGDNYITYKGTYSGSQTAYEGWYKFYYKIDARSAATHQEFQDIVGYLLVEPENTGSAQVKKTSANTAISNANTNYSLENAVFAAFTDRTSAESAATLAAAGSWKTWQEARDWASSNAAFSFVTKANGESPVVEDIEAATYYLCELFAPAGFRLNSEIKSADVEATGNDEDVCVVTFADEPKRGSVDLLKQSNNPDLTHNNPGYSLAGASYGLYTDSACTKLFAEIRTTLNENGDGYGRIDNVPIGSYWVREIKRPLEGYALDTQAYALTVTDQTVTRVNSGSVIDKAKMNPLSLFLQKKDAESTEAYPQGAASLVDAHFRINYYDVKNANLNTLASLEPRASWVVRTDTEGAFRLDAAESTFSSMDEDGSIISLPYKVSGSSFYKLSDGTVALPIGTYTIQEVKAPEGYLLDDTIHVRHVTDENNDREILENFDAEEAGDLITDQVARADLKFVKRADGAAKLAGIPFKLTSKTTGEWHIIVTDQNGMASTSGSVSHPHDQATNANDEQFKAADGSFTMPLVLDEAALSSANGTWFGLDGKGNSLTPDNSLGALPYDTYELEELRCSANALFKMIRDEIVVGERDNGTIIDLGTLNNTATDKPTIHTSAYDGAGEGLYDNEIYADTEVTVIDRVDYSGLEPGVTYQLTGTLMDKTTGEPLRATEEAEAISANVEFIPEDYNGYVNVTFTFDASFITEKQEIVAFETLYRDGQEVAAHRDLTDIRQTITVNPISLATNARDSITGTNIGYPEDTVTIIDAVTYQGLTPHAEYTLTALLMNKQTGQAWEVEGEPITADLTFQPEESSGTVEMEITLPGLDLDGVSLVVFESLLHNDIEVARHADLEDEGQTVAYAYPDLPLPPTGGDVEVEEETETEEPSTLLRNLAQTGDDLIIPFSVAALLCVMGVGLIVVALHRRQNPSSRK